MSISVWFFLLSGVTLNAFAQLMLKFGVDKIGVFNFSYSNIIPIFFKVATNYFIILGLASYVISVIFWLLVLSRVQVSVAYPMVSIGYIITAFAGYFFLGETISITKILGIAVIIIGVYLIVKQ